MKLRAGTMKMVLPLKVVGMPRFPNMEVPISHRSWSKSGLHLLVLHALMVLHALPFHHSIMVIRLDIRLLCRFRLRLRLRNMRWMKARAHPMEGLMEALPGLRDRLEATYLDLLVGILISIQLGCL
jgi:hypothetical protein